MITNGFENLYYKVDYEYKKYNDYKIINKNLKHDKTIQIVALK